MAANSDVSSKNIAVRSTGKTGVEMETLAATGIACLTIYDMLKYVGKDMVLNQIMLVSKTGGKSGDYTRQNQGHIRPCHRAVKGARRTIFLIVRLLILMSLRFAEPAAEPIFTMPNTAR